MAGLRTYHSARDSLAKLVDLGYLVQAGESKYGKVRLSPSILDIISK